jgi:hypothetical protein
LELPPLLLKNLPAEQFVHSGAPPVLNEPGPQGRHAADVPPLSGLNLPAAQLLQEDAPAELKVPLSHGTHVALLLAPLTFEEVPAGHRSQKAAPALLEKLPGAHGMQASELPPEVGLNLPAAQGRHEEAEVAPGVLL